MDFNYFIYCDEGVLKLIVENEYVDSEMAIYLYCDNKKIDVVWYKKSFSYEYVIDPGLLNSSFSASIFIRIGKNIFSKKTKSINPYKLQKKIDFDLSKVDSLKDVLYIEKYVETLAKDNDIESNIFFENIVINDYPINNIFFTDYIFLRYVLSELNLPGNWNNCGLSLGVLNNSIKNHLIELTDGWHRNSKITDFTRSFICALFSINENRYDKAYKLLNKFDIPDEYYFKVYFQGLITYNAKIDAKRNFPYLIKERIVSSKNKMTFTFSCNYIYFDRFFKDMFNSLLANYNEFDIAIALVNFDESDMDAFHIIRKNIEENYNISFSYMVVESAVHEKTLSACSRFFIAHEVLSKVSSNVLILDIDVFFTDKSIRLLSDIVENNGISLSLKTNCQRLIPWVAVAAGANYFPNKNSSLSFLKKVVDYINYSYNSTYNWYLDQNALFYAFRKHKALFPLERINNIHSFTSTLLTKNDSKDLIRWKRGLVRKYKLNN